MPLVSSLRFIATHPLSKGCEIQSILRFARWQIGSRLIKGMVIHDWVGGSRFLVRHGDTGLTGNVYTGLHEFADMGYLLHVLRASDLFVDVGANLGSYTILACAAIGARGFAFEPAPETYHRLVENVRLNRAEERVKCLNVGVGRAECVVKFLNGSDTTNHIAAADEHGVDTINVRICTLDAALDGESPAVAKIDIEGYEEPALEGAQNMLGSASLHTVIMELNGSGRRYGHDESRILMMMSDHGFKAYSYDPLERKLQELGRRRVASGNTLFVRNLALVSERIASAPKVSVFGKLI
jgi:FkbM family methyltransferase